MWKKIGICQDLECDERLWHAGLSPDGSRCFVGGFDDAVYIVWDIRAARKLWENATYEPPAVEYPPLTNWVDRDGYVVIQEGPAAGKYRVFGLYYNPGRTFDEMRGLKLEVDISKHMLIVVEAATCRELQRLEYESFSGDWAFASFSDDGRTIAVIEPYYITFFADDVRR